MVSLIKMLIRWSRISKARKSSTKIAVQQVEYNGKPADCLMIFPYGLDANLPPDALVAMFAVGGNPENRAGIGWLHDKIMNLNEGECAFYHPLTGSFLKWDSSGNGVFESTGNITIKGEVVDVEATTVNVNATTTNLGSGGQPIARLGDAVVVNPATGIGTITAGGTNTSI